MVIPLGPLCGDERVRVRVDLGQACSTPPVAVRHPIPDGEFIAMSARSVRALVGLSGKRPMNRVAAIVTGCGAPMVLLVNSGLLFAPAAHAGALFPGVMPLMVAILAAVILKEGFTLQKSVGLALIAAGAVGIVGGTGRDRHRAERRPRAVSRGGAGLGRLHGRHAARAARRPPCRHHRRGRLARALSAGLRVDRGRPRLQRAALRYCASGRGAGRADRHRGAAPLWTHGRPARRHAARLSSPSLRQ
jgi:multidrug transporter EmrE-like cation transporter